MPTAPLDASQDPEGPAAATHGGADGAADGAGDLAGEARPWGAYVVLDDGPLAKVKRITVDPGQRLSLQVHHRRAEHWVVVSGTALVTLDGEEREVRAGQAVDIPTGTPHRVRNPGHEPLVFVEVQLGEYFGEDDIVRLDDDYGRAG
jgi:mannose-6-phosphate isomerase